MDLVHPVSFGTSGPSFSVSFGLSQFIWLHSKGFPFLQDPFKMSCVKSYSAFFLSTHHRAPTPSLHVLSSATIGHPLHRWMYYLVPPSGTYSIAGCTVYCHRRASTPSIHVLYIATIGHPFHRYMYCLLPPPGIHSIATCTI